MTLQLSLISFYYVAIFTLVIVQHTKCHQTFEHNISAVSQRTERVETQTPNITSFFDLSRVKSMSDGEIEHNYKSIILTMRREGRGVLKYFQSDMLKMVFNNHHNEPEANVRERWYEQCDFLLDNEDVEHFKYYVMNEDDTIADGTKMETAAGLSMAGLGGM